MEAKDSVILEILATHGYPIENAEKILNNVGRAIYQAGIREVVEWLIKHDHPILNKRSNCLITSGEWQTKKKEWGL